MPKKTSEFDAVVIGGGPSGSSAARRLAQRGLSTLLLERSPMPRRKLCGGALSEQAMSYLDFEIPGSLVDWECFGARVHYGDRVVEGRLASRIAVLVTRARFDAFLFEKALDAGVTGRFEKVKRVEPGERAVLVETESERYRAGVVVIAAGANNKLVELVRPRDDKDGFGVTQEVEIPTEPGDRFADLEGLIDIHFGVARFGYGWVFHHGNHYSIGVGGLRSKMSNPALAMKTFLESMDFAGPYPGLKGHPIPRGGLPRPIVGDRIVLVGDSAGFVDPFYGEGIAYAIRSGQIAADVLGDLSASSPEYPASALAEYPRRCAAEFATNLSYSLILSKLMYRFPAVFLRILVSDRRIIEKYLEIPMDRLTYREFLGWMIPRVPWYFARSLVLKRRPASAPIASSR